MAASAVPSQPQALDKMPDDESGNECNDKTGEDDNEVGGRTPVENVSLGQGRELGGRISGFGHADDPGRSSRIAGHGKRRGHGFCGGNNPRREDRSKWKGHDIAVVSLSYKNCRVVSQKRGQRRSKWSRIC